MNGTHPRLVADSLATHLRVMPVVVVTGARQTGKSTLARELSPGPRRFLSFDDFDVLTLARDDPSALVGGTAPLTLDEVQRLPDVLHAVKQDVDRERRVGKFLLTGSANLLLMRRVSESLAGRASYLTLWPMTRRERLGLGRCGIWDDLLTNSDRHWLDIVLAQGGPASHWRECVRLGGFPVPALQMNDAKERAIWFDGYLRTYLERDLLNLSTLGNLPDFRRLMRAACLRMGQTLNQTELARDVALSQPTVRRYLSLLETSYMLVRLPAYAVNRTKRLIKSPKIYWSDTGLSLHISGAGEPGSAYLKALILNDLLAWRDAGPNAAEICHWRTTVGDEVDFVVEADGTLLPIEVKASNRPRLRDTTQLRTFRKEYPGRTRAGLLLHAGDAVEWLTPDVLAAPWWRVV